VKDSTITQLNQLNQSFYQTIGESFDATRQSYWPGWTGPLFTYLTEHFTATKNSLHPIKVLDIGCGNGRFGQFLAESFPDLIWNYTGIDNSQLLLDRAALKLKNLTNLTPHFLKVDIIETSLPITDQFDLIVAFGVLHHLPGQQTRQRFFDQLATMIKPAGLVALSCWQFADDPKLRQRYADPQKAQIDSSELDENDFILDWRAGETAYRYCHHYTDQELAKLTANWHLKKSFFADGHSGQLNRYLLLARTSIESSA
jgi:tRNA (uracil-5-)-methyltransferase TRM9